MSQTPDVALFAVPDLDFPLDELEDLPAEQLFLVPFRPDATEEHKQRAYEIFWARKAAAERAGSGGAQGKGVGLQVGKANDPWTGSHRRLSSIGDTEEGLPTPGGSQDGGAADFEGLVPAGDKVEKALTNGQAHQSASTSATPFASSSQTNHFNQTSGAASSSLAPLSSSITDPSSDSAKSPFGAFPTHSSTRPLRKNGFYADASSSRDTPSSSTEKQKKDKGKGKAVELPGEAAEFSGTTTSEATPSFSPSTSVHPRATRSTHSTDAKNLRWQRGPDRSIEVVVEIPLHPAMTNLSPALRKKLFGKKAAPVKKEIGAKKEKVASTMPSGTKRKTRSSLAAAEQAEDEATERAAKKRKMSTVVEGKKPAQASPSTTSRRGRSSATSTASTSKRKTRRSSSAGFEVLIETPKRPTSFAKAGSSIKGKGKGAAGSPSVRSPTMATSSLAATTRLRSSRAPTRSSAPQIKRCSTRGTTSLSAPSVRAADSRPAAVPRIWLATRRLSRKARPRPLVTTKPICSPVSSPSHPRTPPKQVLRLPRRPVSPKLRKRCKTSSSAVRIARSSWMRQRWLRSLLLSRRTGRSRLGRLMRTEERRRKSMSWTTTLVSLSSKPSLASAPAARVRMSRRARPASSPVSTLPLLRLSQPVPPPLPTALHPPPPPQSPPLPNPSPPRALSAPPAQQTTKTRSSLPRCASTKRGRRRGAGRHG
ncbi:RHTO0S25e01838g1_1 [Rhodotorula toruloides]|uniref:RHTO0S25e01838g1_1 n=1 Tax=Rhodotorula toruloides TaxID=5286 RepID=A0A061BHA3_RHOTO|nr:RHTO0S25e01838g1_1 [Rhodotorula toruloides]